MSLRKLINIAIGFILAVLLLWLFFKDTDWAAVEASIAAVRVELLALALLGTFASIALRAWRWRLLLAHLKPAKIPYLPVISAYVAGFAITTLLPGRLGEVVRPYLLARDVEIPFMASLATLVTERIVDLIMVLSLIASGFILRDPLGAAFTGGTAGPFIQMVEAVAFVSLMIAVLAVIAIILLMFNRDLARRLAEFALKPVPKKISAKLLGLMDRFIEGLAGIRSPRTSLLLAGATVANWLLITGNIWMVLTAFGIDVPWHFTLFLLGAQALGLVVPTPAGAGSYHAVAILVCTSLWGVQADLARSYAIVMHLITFSPFIILGLPLMLFGHINIFRVVREAKSESGSSGDIQPA